MARGRRSGESTARDDILSAARKEFAERGFRSSTLRSIASTAGVDAAMIKHYFGSKDGLFASTIELPFDPSKLVAGVLSGPLDSIGTRLATTFVTMWDSAGGESATSLMRSAMQEPWAKEIFHDFLIQRVLRKGFTTYLGGWGKQQQWRASLVASQLVGLLVARYILKIEPLASAKPSEVVRAVAPTLQHYLTGDVGKAPTVKTGR